MEYLDLYLPEREALRRVYQIKLPETIPSSLVDSEGNYGGYLDDRLHWFWIGQRNKDTKPSFMKNDKVNRKVYEWYFGSPFESRKPVFGRMCGEVECMNPMHHRFMPKPHRFLTSEEKESFCFTEWRKPETPHPYLEYLVGDWDGNGYSLSSIMYITEPLDKEVYEV